MLIKTILEREGLSIASDIRVKLVSTGANATGKTSASLESIATEDRLLIKGDKSFLFVERGRGAGRRPPIQPIKEWAIARGIITTDPRTQGIAYGIANKIAKEGTVLHRTNSVRDIYTETITDDRIDAIKDQIAGKYAEQVLSDVIKAFKK